MENRKNRTNQNWVNNEWEAIIEEMIAKIFSTVDTNPKISRTHLHGKANGRKIIILQHITRYSKRQEGMKRLKMRN